MNKSELFRQAWQMKKAGTYTTFSEALKAAWKRWKLTNRLKSGVVSFSFTKEDGSLRIALGTLESGRFEYTPKGNGERKPNPNVVKYFDLEKNAIRAVRLDRLQTIN
jgi:hypothetical protein